jgi:hypothetical protein
MIISGFNKEFENNDLKHEANNVPKETITQNTLNTLNFANNYNLPFPLKIIARETYCLPNVKNYCDNIMKSFGDLYNNSSLKPIFDVFALKTHLDSKSYMVIKDKDYILSSDVAALYWWNGKIEISSKNYQVNDYKLPGVAIHEMSHSVMHYVFNNDCYPYHRNNTSMRDNFERAEKDTLINFYKVILPHENSNNLQNKNSWEIGNIIANSNFWTKNHLDYRTKLIINKFIEVFSTGYEESSNHKEFIVRLYQLVGEQYNKYELNMAQPLINYVNNFINPYVNMVLANNGHTAGLSISPSYNGKYANEFALNSANEQEYPDYLLELNGVQNDMVIESV